jgi:hypothetical protein
VPQKLGHHARLFPVGFLRINHLRLPRVAHLRFPVQKEKGGGLLRPPPSEWKPVKRKIELTLCGDPASPDTKDQRPDTQKVEAEKRG